MKWIALVVLGGLAGAALAAAAAKAAPAPHVTGRWYTEDKECVVEIYTTPRGTLEGKIVSGRHPDRLDTKNPDPALRTRKVVGTVIMKDMKPNSPGQWSGGTIYDPDSGKTYRCKLKLSGPDTIDLRGYIGISLIGRTSRWTRVTP